MEEKGQSRRERQKEYERKVRRVDRFIIEIFMSIALSFFTTIFVLKLVGVI